jgi:Asp-tRNA(Asn)/Glu-tRNA(Gln) amidotransferase B subunit
VGSGDRHRDARSALDAIEDFLRQFDGLRRRAERAGQRVDLALPGVLPVLNKGAVECAIRFGLAVDGEVAPKSVFARKNYFYPDLPKGYQISQYELPVVVGGKVAIQLGQGDERRPKRRST